MLMFRSNMDPLLQQTSPDLPAQDAAPERLTGKDAGELLAWLLAAAIGVLVATRFFWAAFPEAAMDLRISRDEAESIARAFIQESIDPTSADHPLDSYEHTKVFRVEEDANDGGPKVYLERELGLEQANQLMAGKLSVWYWEIRYFRPGQQEEYRARVTPDGRLAGYTHILEESRAGPRLEQDAARAIAEELARKRIGAPLDDYDFLPAEANATERPNRRDWKFTWERRGFKAKDAPYQMEMIVHGDQVGGYREFLKVPETWTRDYQRLRSTNTLYQFVAQLPYMFLLGGVLLMIFDLGKKRLVGWEGAIRLGLVLAALYFLMNVNQWPLTRAEYDTNSSYGGFVLAQFSSAAILSLLLGMMVAFSVAAGEPLYRLQKPEALQLGALFRRSSWYPALRSKEFFKSSVIGLCLAAVHIGFVVAFYLAGRRIGFWSPQEVRYVDSISTLAPWLFPLAISLFAATSEEFLFRLFAIPLLLRITRNKLVAIVLPAFIWGFLHSAYPQQPGYVRGIEVGLIGIVAGWVMLRWGILATLVWHYTVDALLIGLFLLRAEGLYYKASGAVVVALAVFPLLAALGFFAWHRRFVADAALANAALPLAPRAKAHEGPVPPPETAGPAWLSPAMRRWLPVAGVLGIALLLAPKPEAIGNFVRFSITAPDAGQRADSVLSNLKLDPRKYHRVIAVVNNFHGDTVEFLRRELGTAETNVLFRQRVPAAFWRIRYFRDSEKEEFHVVLLPDGSFHSLHHWMDERTEGATLAKEEARARAEAFLSQSKGVDLTRWKLVEANSEKQAKRTDHVLVWEEMAPLTREGSSTPPEAAAHVRIEVKVQGDEVSGYRKFVKLPEEWLRKHNEDTLARTAYSIARIASVAGLAVLAVVIFFANMGKHPVPWSRMSQWALWSALAILLNTANNLPKFFLPYGTEWPLKIFFVLAGLSIFFSLAIVYGAVFLAFSLAWFFLSRSFGEAQIPGWRGMPRSYYRDALLLGLSGVSLIMVVLGRLPLWLDQAFPTLKQSIGVAVPEVDSYFPALSDIAGAVILGLLVSALIGLFAGFAGQWRIRPAAPVLFFVLLILVFAGAPANGPDYAKNAALAAVQVGICWWLVTRVYRFNLLGYFLTISILPLVASVMELARQPALFYKLNGAVSALGIAGLVGLALFLSRSASEEAPSP